jgi:polar amino acid transport system substrate-binding protein
VTGFVRNTLQAGKSDVVMGYAQGDDLVLNTNHYYTSTHVIVVKADGDLADVDTLADPRLKGRRLGVVIGSPPATHVARLGLMKDAEPYPMMIDRRVGDPAGQILADVESGRIDAALLWGPIGGPLVKQGHPKLVATPLLKEQTPPRLVFRITMGVRPARTSGSASSTARSGGTRPRSTRSCATRAFRSSTISARGRSRPLADAAGGAGTTKV